ncbi:MAG: cytochrome c biogenesis protein CcsA [Gammaproteobacteria bacterium]|nr:cytochrome c biogenesis protein CcsA [Gammaproteobacteria bacterium]MDH3751929.1 cytochrome c biogenesis protein CcsA [Gammaproteobacteria bacterium]MDH3806080.1 cytochrome c biogenesis protein CcsA [Gammaproteobacteria bacterium]
MSQITILLLYLLAAVAFALSRLPRYAAWTQPLLVAAVGFSVAGLMLHGQGLYVEINKVSGLSVSLAGAVSLIGLQLALIGLLGALEPTLRGMTAGLLLLAAVATIPIDMQPKIETVLDLSWQMQAHILIAMFAYGLLTAGAIVAVFALIQNRRLRAGKLSSANYLFAPLETTEKMLFGVAAAGFSGLLLAVLSGFAFVENLFAQHLVHKTAFSLLALLLFGVLVAGRVFAGWRGKRAVYLYLWGFAFLCLAYFGSRYVLEEVLNRSWS